MTDEHWDVVVVGSGFGGSVSALRLVEKGYRVLLCEAGRRFSDAEYAKNAWDIKNYVFEPRAGLYGIQRFWILKGLVALAGAGLGGGSLNYSGTLLVPGDDYYRHPQWAHITDWKSELAPWYDQAQRMLGANTDQPLTPGDEALRRVAERMGVGETFHKVPVGILNTPQPGEAVGDPYFGGVGPDRHGCIYCGACMTGCHYNAKNTLPKNYIYLAERAGASVLTMTTVKNITARGGAHDLQGFDVELASTRRGKEPTRTVTADHVVMAGGVLGTQLLLHTMKANGRLPRLSDRLGVLTRTNAEFLGGATAGGYDVDYSYGVCQGTSFYPDDATHVEIVRNGKGSNVTSLLMTLLTPGNEPGSADVPRLRRYLQQVGRHPALLAKSLWVRRWSERGLIVLAMQSSDASITVTATPNRAGGVTLRTESGAEPEAEWMPIAHEATRVLADEMGGAAFGTYPEVVQIPMTSHVLGGCVIGDSPQTGVIDAYHRVYGHPGLHVVDGSAVTANLGVNPALTITAQAERVMSLWPNKGEPDPRPTPEEDYRALAPVAPVAPIVPKSAPGALRPR